MASIALLDDYQNVALGMADWSGLQKSHKVVAFNQRLPDVEAAAKALAEFDVIGVMRERTPFQRALFDRLPKLKLLVTTGKRNASIDLEAAKARGVTVCNTGGAGRSTAELAIGLMIALARHFREEFAAMRPGGGWQTTLGMDLEGKTLGLLGLGNLGARVGRIGAAMGMKLIAWSQNLTPEQARERGAERVEKDELFVEPAPEAGQVFDVGELTVGYRYDFLRGEHVALGIGAAGTLSQVPRELHDAYGNMPSAGLLFVRATLR